MKKLIVLSLCFAFFNILCSENDNREIKFVVHSSILSDSESVFISGNDSLLGEWNPDKIMLEKTNDSIWSRSFQFQKGENLEFKFTKGS